VRAARDRDEEDPMSSLAPRALRRSILRPIAAIPLAVLAALGLACGPSGSSGTPDANRDGPQDGLPVGSPCNDKSVCGSPTSPECLTKIKPLEMLAGVPAELAELGLEFPSGYCSSVLDCTGDADCYTMGACYRPFREVTADTLRQLEPPLMVSTGSLDFLPTYGVCMRPCTTADQCEVGQICEPPLNDLVSLVPGAINDRSFCVPDPDCPDTGCTAGACSPNPCMNGGTCTASGSSYTCACPDGFSGMNCETAAQPRDRVIGQSCEIDAQCNVPGTARCLSEVHPLEDTLPSTSPLSQIGLDFPRGYCSNEIGCASDIQCGASGKCMAPFREVTAETFRELEAPLELAPGALDFLGSYGVCLRSCVDTFDCFADQTCQYAMADFIALVPGSVNDKTFCVPNEDCRSCDPDAYCDVDANGNGTCVCNPGFEDHGGGLNCTPRGTGACADTPCENGGTCTDGPDTTYTCACPAGYEGTNCQIVAACAPNPCRNDGVCSGNGSGGFTCACTGGWSGPTCESTTMCPILPEPTNGGVTVTNQGVGGVATYTCDAGFERQGAAPRTCGSDGNWSGSAPTCVPAQGACASAPCMHGGVCTPGSGSNFTCDCTGTGYTGTTCQTPVNCGGLGTITNGTISTSPPSSTTFGTTATYACNTGYMLSGSATRTCQANATWSGTAPTCVASSCGTHTDVVYRLTATFAIRNTPAGAGNQSFPNLTNNATTPPFVEGNGNSTPFTGGGTFAQGFARLRFTNNASGQPTAGTVRLVELYLPLEFTQTAGATLYANNDHSVGILSSPGSLTNCGGGDATCMNHAPTVNRTCAPNASGSLTGTSLTWGSCTPAFPTDSTRWRYTNARGVTGAGCAASYVQYGNNTSSSILVPASGKGDAYQVYNQQLSPITFSGTNYMTATWSMAEYQIPNGTGQSNTWVTITGATPIGTDCGSTPGTDLVCNLQ
jgi:Notch-like protein